jgi:peptide deformylase
MTMGDNPAQRAWDAFVAELARWRLTRGLSKKQLAAAMGFDPSYVSHVEARRHRPTEDFARRAEMVLRAGGVVWERFREYDEVRSTARARAAAPGRESRTEQWLPPGVGLVVEHEVAELAYVDGAYVCRVHRDLYNAGTEPVTRYLIRIAVDRYPGQPALSNQHYRDHPLAFDELELRASCAGEAMAWRAKTDRDAFKEVWLLFENDQGRFPLYPGQRAGITYSYRVGADKWGPWFQRAVRLPTRRLTVRLDFPVGLGPVVWGVESSLSSEAVPLRTPIEQEIDGDRAIFTWDTDAPALHARYRLEWRYRTPPVGAATPAGTVGAGRADAGGDGRADVGGDGRADAGGDGRADRAAGQPAGTAARATADSAADSAGEPAGDRMRAGVGMRASDRMRAAGIVQRGAQVLRTPARLLDLPRQQALARDLVARLLAALDRIGELHRFTKGMGLAAPQINLGWAAAVVRPPAPESAPIVLVNPRVVATSPETDEQYEGCLSFFDVRGRVARPLWMEVESVDYTGARTLTRYARAEARLVAHEIDHLRGQLYVDLMRTEAELVPLERYRDTGRPWSY